MPAPTILYVSGYTEPGYGAGPGVVRHALFGDGTIGTALASSTGMANPSFLASGGGVLLVVEELAEGRIAALDPSTLEVLGRGPSGGSDPCHLVYTDTFSDGEIWAANYSSGTASVTELAGLLGRSTAELPAMLSHPGSGPVQDRQGESHAHQVTPTPWGSVLVSDLGADRVDEYSAESRVRLGSAELPPGTGPRHVVITGDFLLVAGELDGFLHVLRRTPVDPAAADPDSGGHFWRWLCRTPLAAAADSVADAKEFYPSHIQLSADGRKLYGAVRGPNTLVTLDLDPLAATPPAPPTVLREVPCGGNWPRHFAIGDAKIYVANQLSNTVSVFELDADGLPAAVPVQSMDFGSPCCVLLA